MPYRCQLSTRYRNFVLGRGQGIRLYLYLTSSPGTFVSTSDYLPRRLLYFPSTLMISCSTIPAILCFVPEALPADLLERT